MFIVEILQRGMARPGTLPSAGEIAQNIHAEERSLSRSAGRLPR